MKKMRSLNMLNLFVPLFMGAMLTLAACAKKDDGGGSGVVATTPQACNTTANGTCDPSFYGNQPGLVIPGIQTYTYGQTNGYCGCQTGYRPIYSYQYGFACAPTNYMNYSGYMGYNINSIYQAQNTYPTTMGQIYYNPITYGGQSNCYQSVATSCDVRIANSCANGGACRAIGGGSTVGVCTTGTGYDNYGGVGGGYNGYYPYGGGYGYNNGYGYGGNNNCTVRTNSWGFSYYYCYGAGTGYGGIPR